MRSISGKYELQDASAAAFFGTHTFNLIVREGGLTGRFGREGFIQGTVSGQDVAAVWHDRTRKGWMRVRFGAGFRNGDFDYGLASSNDPLGHSLFVKRLRSSRAHRAQTALGQEPQRVNDNRM